MNDYITYTSPIERAMTRIGTIGVIVLVSVCAAIGSWIGGLA
jgi:hypothetical protein